MENNTDDKGKIFTNFITKKPIIVTIQTTTQCIHGEVYIRMGERLKDELNSTEQFLAVTNAVVKNAQNEELYRCHFLVLNRGQIVWVMPDDEMKQLNTEEPEMKDEQSCE